MGRAETRLFQTDYYEADMTKSSHLKQPRQRVKIINPCMSFSHKGEATFCVRNADGNKAVTARQYNHSSRAHNLMGVATPAASDSGISTYRCRQNPRSPPLFWPLCADHIWSVRTAYVPIIFRKFSSRPGANALIQHFSTMKSAISCSAASRRSKYSYIIHPNLAKQV